MIDFVRHYMYSKAERHSLKKKLEKIADQFSFKPKLFFVFGFFLQRVGTVECNLIEYLCLRLEAMTIQICAWYITRNFFCLF